MTVTDQSIFVEEIEGFSHAADFSICEVNRHIFQPSGAMRLIVHAIHALRVEGVLTDGRRPHAEDDKRQPILIAIMQGERPPWFVLGSYVNQWTISA